MYAFSKSGLKISKDRQKDLQQTLNRQAANELKKAETIQAINRELNDIEISINGMNGIYKIDTVEQLVKLKERRGELRDKLVKLAMPKKQAKKKQPKLKFLPKGMRNNAGDSVNTTVTFRGVTGSSVTFDEPESIPTEDKTPWSGRTATVASVKRGKTCKSDKPKRARRMPTGKMTSEQAVVKVFNERTDVPKNSEMQHMSNSDYVMFINEPERVAQIERVMAQPEKGSTKKQGGSPNGGSKPRFIRECPRTRLVKAGVPLKPMGNN